MRPASIYCSAAANQPIIHKSQLPLYPSENSNQSEECAICFDHHSKQNEQEVRLIRLKCKHSFGDACINNWLYVSPNINCPTCRTEVTSTNICALCDTIINSWEPTCIYDCKYLCGWFHQNERHTLHRRCIEPLVRKTAFKAEEDRGIIKKGDVVFNCPLRHKHGTNSCLTHHKVLLYKVIPVDQYDDQSFPEQSILENKDLCRICHKDILLNQAKCTYLCKYRDSGAQEEQHVFHKTCLQPYAERNAHKQKKDGIETGKLVFDCPSDHDCAVWYPSDLEIELPPDFTPDNKNIIKDACVVCNIAVDRSHSESIVLEVNCFGNWLDHFEETILFHNECYGEFLLNNVHKVVGSGENISYICPCPYHIGTPKAHAFEVPWNGKHMRFGPLSSLSKKAVRTFKGDS